MRSETEAARAVTLYADTVRRICWMHLKNYSDVEDVFQDVFLKYVLDSRCFDSDEHEKAWVIRVTVNRCHDLQKSFFRKRVTSLDAVEQQPAVMDEELRDTADAIRALPPNYRDVIFLFYYEGYTAVEIAKILKKNENTVYTWLSRAREQLRGELGGGFDE